LAARCVVIVINNNNIIIIHLISALKIKNILQLGTILNNEASMFEGGFFQIFSMQVSIFQNFQQFEK
jgi:hypothetical protein